MLVHKFMMKAGANVLGSALSFVSLMVMTRYVGEQYGIMMWGWAFTAMFNAFSDLGFNSANLRYLSKRDDNQNAYFSTFFAVKILLSLTVTIMSWVSVYLTYSNGSMDQESLGVCIVFVAYYLLYNIQTALTVSYDGRMENGKSSIALTIEYLVRSVLLIILALSGADPSTLSSAYLVGIIISMASCLMMLRNTGLRLVRPTFVKTYANFAAPLAFSIMAIAIIEYLDKVLIGLYHNSMEVGYYTAAAGVMGAFTVLGTSLNNVLLPHLSREGRSDREGVEHTLWMTEKYITILLLPVLVFLLILGRPIAIVLFGSGYADSGDVLSIQSIHIYVFIFTGLMAQVLYSIDRSAIYLKASLIFVAVSLIGFITLIPDTFMGFDMAGLGGVGAATALAVAYTIFASILVYMVRKELGYTLCPGFWKLFVAGAAGSVFLLALDAMFNVDGLIQLAIVGIASEGVFFATLWALKGFNRDDFEFIKTALSPRNLKESVTEEWK